MTDLTIEALREILRTELAPLAPMRTQLDAVRDELFAIRPHLAGIPLTGAAIETLRHEFRQMRAALNDMARVNITAGEVEAMHTDIDKMQTAVDELTARMTAAEQALAELRRQTAG